MERYPKMDDEFLIKLYQSQWTIMADTLRNKKKFSFHVPSLGFFKFNHFAIPLVIAQYEVMLDRIDDKGFSEERKQKMIDRINQKIHELKLIIYFVYEKRKFDREKFKSYWQRHFVEKNKKRKTNHTNYLARYIRRVLEEFNICFPDKDFEECYPETEGDL